MTCVTNRNHHAVVDVAIRVDEASLASAASTRTGEFARKDKTRLA